MTMRRGDHILLSIVLIAAAGILSLPSSIAVAGRPHGGPAPGPRVTVTTAQIQLTLHLPSAAYPLNALVPATVSLTNRTARSISTWDCLASSLGVEVVAIQGLAVYPPLLPPPGAPWSSCPGVVGAAPVRHGVRILPGATLVRTVNIVVRARTVRAWVDLDLGAGQGKPDAIVTGVVHINPANTPTPGVTLERSPSLVAHVTPVPGAGPVYYSEFARCSGTVTTRDRVVTTAPYSQWSVAPSSRLRPFSAPLCAVPAEWVLFVGQIGLPIQQVYYCRQRNLCAYAPPTPREHALGACKVDIAKAVESGQLPRSAVRYAIGLASSPPTGLNAVQRRLARSFHSRCAPLLHTRQP